MVDLGNEGGGLPIAGDGQNQPPATTETLGAPIVAPAATTNPNVPLTAADLLSMFADLKTAMLKKAR